MKLIFIILFCYLPFNGLCVSCPETTKKPPFIDVEPATLRDCELFVAKQEFELLNLTCSVVDNTSDFEPTYRINWITPNKSKSHVEKQEPFPNSERLLIKEVEMGDNGIYKCEAHPINESQEILTTTINVNIKSRKECGNTMFTCHLSKLNNCIHRRFTCDGHQDCEHGEDENQALCGVSACLNKVPCRDSDVVRCIPKNWCCDRRIDVNCTIKEPLTCCPNFFTRFHDDRNYYNPSKPHMTDMEFALYTVIGCAMVLIVGVTVLIIAICKINSRPHWANSLSPRTSHHLSENARYDVDLFCHGQPSLLMRYNSDPEVQTSHFAMQPPPYSQVMSMLPKDGPPPPYSPRDAAEAETLLTETTSEF